MRLPWRTYQAVLTIISSFNLLVTDRESDKQRLPKKLTYNKIGLTKVLKYNFADITQEAAVLKYR